MTGYVSKKAMAGSRMPNKDILRKAAKDSGLDVYGLGLNLDKWEAALARYTEIIVLECAEVILETPVKYTEIDIMHIIRDHVKEHFGVKA
jgi:hypothetical protein